MASRDRPTLEQSQATVCLPGPCPVPMYPPRPPEPPSTTSSFPAAASGFCPYASSPENPEGPQRDECSNVTLMVGQMPGTPFPPSSFHHSPPSFGHPLPSTPSTSRHQTEAGFIHLLPRCPCAGPYLYNRPWQPWGTAQPGPTSLPSKDSEQDPGHPNIKNGTQRPDCLSELGNTLVGQWRKP